MFKLFKIEPTCKLCGYPLRNGWFYHESDERLCDMCVITEIKRDRKMKFDLEYLAEHFEYKSDVKLDNWQIMKKDNLKGDCDDYAVTALFVLSDHSLFKFWLNILTFRAILWHCKSPAGGGHLVLKFKDKYIDNWGRELLPKSEFDNDGYKFLIPMIFPFPAIKMFFGVIVRLFRG